MMDILEHHHELLLSQFNAATSDLAVLHATLHDDVLPQLELELCLTDPDVKWLSEWLSDTASVFRILRRHKFIRPFTLQEIHTISIWRIHVLRPTLFLPLPTLFHCLPPPITDPFGRPLLFLKLASLQSLQCSIKDVLLQEVERLRLHLRYIRDHHAYTGSVPLQYLILVDLDKVSIQNLDLDLCSWILTDIISRYPGMLAAVFLLNYSWIHSGAWSVAKRILPSSTIARVFFPSKTQLVDYCSAANLPAEYGGSLPTLDQIDDALRSHHFLPPPPPPLPHLPNSPVLGIKNASPFGHSRQHGSSLRRVSSTIALPALSSRNPFFGYPAIASASNPHKIRHVQKGTRELLRTLAVLWWRRWKRWVWMGMYILLLALVLRRRMRLWYARARVGVTLRASLGSLKTLIRAFDR